MKIKLNHSSIVIFSLIVILGEANYWAIYPKFIKLTLRVALLVLAAGLPVFVYNRHNWRRLKKKTIWLFIPWAFYCGCVLINNQELVRGGYYNTLRIVICLILSFSCSLDYRWLNKAPWVIFLVGMPNVVATILFFVNSGLYRKFVKFAYHGYQNGTANGLYGYHAALADHYSQNGTYISMVLLAITAVYVASDQQKNQKRYLILSIVSAIGLLLTTKRAHLIFSIVAIVVVYYALNPGRMFGRTFKLVVTMAIILLGFNISATVVPALSDTINRIVSMGDDIQSTSRLVMWKYAIDYFKNNPMFGIGWYGYRYKNILGYTSSASGCHNIYFELLCETGLVGFVIFIVCAVSSIVKTIRNIALDRDDGRYRATLAVSLAIQTFVLLYGMTGNALYDTTFYFYMVAVTIGLAYDNNLDSIMREYSMNSIVKYEDADY